jgi:archaellum component FlaC
MLGNKAFLQNLNRTVMAWIQRKKVQRQAALQRETAVLAAIEQVVEKANPRIRAIGGYQKKLRPAVENALQYIDELAATIPEPIEIKHKAWFADPYLNAFFATADEMQILFSRSAELRQFFERQAVAESYLFLAMTRREKGILGMKMAGDIIQREVPQTTVSFGDYLVGMPTATEAETRAELKSRALNFLVNQVLENILALRTQRETLQQHRQILKIKLRVLQNKQHGLESLLQAGDDIEAELNSLQQKLAENEQNLQEIWEQMDELEDYVDHLNTVLAHPQTYLSVTKVAMKLNRMGIKLDENSAEAGHEISFPEFTGGRTQLKRIFLLVKYPANEMLSREQLRALTRPYLTSI